MYRGRLVEAGDSKSVYLSPKHPYTRDFLGTVLHVRKGGQWEAAAARAEDLEEISRQSPEPGAARAGCVYAGTCSERFDPCKTVKPELLRTTDDRWVACHLYRPPPVAQQQQKTA